MLMITQYRCMLTSSSLLHFRMNSSAPPSGLSNTTFTPARPSSLGMSFFTMTFGAISNLTALGILVKSRVRILCYVSSYKQHVPAHSPSKIFCQIFGTSMVFFGLSPLLLGCAMAAERFVAICFPFFHAATITKTHVRRVVLLLYFTALLIAILPLFKIGTYTVQQPGTWCFLQILSPPSRQDIDMALAFSCLGITALTSSLLCNILSGLVLLQARRKSQNGNIKSDNRCARRPSTASSTSLFCSLDVEMMVQLAVITVVSCVCWSPFLIHILVLQSNQSSSDSPHRSDMFLLLGLRMASWNQILDPWVYILLRRTVLFRLCCGKTFTNFKYSWRRETFTLQ
uniref:Thromboxane A2 receptor n=1 Tax=Neogobius melanostomus TaxID=47308 RepID=A0A8C6TNV8_9GOBI